MKISVCLTVALLSIAVSLPSAHGDFLRLFIDSEPGDFIGQGQNRTIEYDSDFGSTVSANNFLNANGLPESIQFIVDGGVGETDNTFSTIAFATRRLDLPLQTGFFDDARRFPFEPDGAPGLDVTFQNRGSNMLEGEFTINQIDFIENPNGGGLIVGRLDVSFEQHSEFAAPALFGNVFFQSSAFVVPEPNVAVLLMLCLLKPICRRSRPRDLQ